MGNVNKVLVGLLLRERRLKTCCLCAQQTGAVKAVTVDTPEAQTNKTKAGSISSALAGELEQKVLPGGPPAPEGASEDRRRSTSCSGGACETSGNWGSSRTPFTNPVQSKSHNGQGEGARFTRQVQLHHTQQLLGGCLGGGGRSVLTVCSKLQQRRTCRTSLVTLNTQILTSEVGQAALNNPAWTGRGTGGWVEGRAGEAPSSCLEPHLDLGGLRGAGGGGRKPLVFLCSSFVGLVAKLTGVWLRPH